MSNYTLVEDLDDDTPILPSGEVDRASKHIRGHHKPLNESGMYVQPEARTYPQQLSHDNSYEHTNNYVEQPEKTCGCHTQTTCIDSMDHIQSCPMCSKFYKSDKTLYIVIIIILSIICIMLLKKVLDL